MFVDLLARLRWVVESPSTEGLRLAQKSLLMYAAFRDGAEDGCSAGTERIAKELGVSENTIRRSFDALVAKGLLSETARPGRTTSYRLTYGGVPQGHPSQVGTPANGTPLNGTRTEKEHLIPSQENIIPGRKKSSSRRGSKAVPEQIPYRSRWIELWNGIEKAPGVPRARVFRRESEEKLLSRAAELGFDEAGLESLLREKLPTLCEVMQPRITLSWLAEGLQTGLQSLANGQYDDDKLVRERMAKESAAREDRRKREAERELDRRAKELVSQITKGGVA